MKRTVLAAMTLLACALVNAADDDSAIAHTEQFDLHSDPWINLHHFLYHWSRADEGVGSGRQTVVVPERESMGELPAADRAMWEEALIFYRASVARLSHFDEAMLEQKYSLREAGGDIEATPEEHIEGIIEALRTAMPVYVRHWWSDHDAGNRNWVNTILADVEEFEGRFADLMRRLWGVEWPAELSRVDVSAYANFAAGYTAYGHIVIFASDPGNQGHYGFETLFHEVQHSRFVSRPARDRIAAHIDPDIAPWPPNFWHSFIFATAGVFAAEIAEQRGYAPHRPYWEREGINGFSGWRDGAALVSAEWIPAVTGSTEAPLALARIRERMAGQ